MDWQHDGADWPNREASRFVQAGGLRWHVQQMGQGPVLLLLHGTGAASHSWRDLMPLLAPDFTVVAPDLPGHGFSGPLPAGHAGLPGMAAALAGLLQALGHAPALVVGHSAGAAISAQWALHQPADGLQRLVWLAGALRPFDGWAGLVAPALARLMSRSALVPRLAAWRARDAAAVQRLIHSTGSRIDARGLAAYARLLRSPSHLAGALAMMAGWDLQALPPQLPGLPLPVWLLHGSADRTVPAAESQRLAERLPQARLVMLPGLGHLAHEEAPAQVAGWLQQAWAEVRQAGRAGTAAGLTQPAALP